MEVAVASGKGGTGKTLVATSLARLFAEEGRAVAYVDADVEAPNGHLFLSPHIDTETRFEVKVPVLRTETCAGHGKCQEICAYHAILTKKGGVIVFDELCHSCGACILACPDEALTEREREVGTIRSGHAGRVRFLEGRLDVGEARSAPLISQVVDIAVNWAHPDEVVLIDAPPGTSCAATAAVAEADLLLLVTEPTPFGRSDLALAVEMGRALGRRMAGVINRADLGDDAVEQLFGAHDIPVLARIPFDRTVAEAYAAGRLAVEDCPEFRDRLSALARELVP
jgi:MinD superfamily P-loop ATPase